MNTENWLPGSLLVESENVSDSYPLFRSCNFPLWHEFVVMQAFILLFGYLLSLPAKTVNFISRNLVSLLHSYLPCPNECLAQSRHSMTICSVNEWVNEWMRGGLPLLKGQCFLRNIDRKGSFSAASQGTLWAVFGWCLLPVNAGSLPSPQCVCCWGMRFVSGFSAQTSEECNETRSSSLTSIASAWNNLPSKKIKITPHSWFPKINQLKQKSCYCQSRSTVGDEGLQK